MQINWKKLWKEFNVWHHQQSWIGQAQKIRRLVFSQGEISATFNWKKIWKTVSQSIKNYEYGFPEWDWQRKQIRKAIDKECENV